MRRDQRGFTLVEVIVVAGIIAILAGALIPLILKEIDEARSSRAYADIRAISAAVLVLKKDTGKWAQAATAGCATDLAYLKGAGNTPTVLPPDVGAGATGMLDDALTADTFGCYGPNWKGPYMTSVGADPWGNFYLLDSESFGGSPVWLISAGPDGQFQTGVGSKTLVGDDVGIRLK